MAQDQHEPDEYMPADRLSFTSRESLSDDGESDLDDSDVHLASIEEKKRLWFKNAAINALFIGAW
jgi:hypothetical protein